MEDMRLSAAFFELGLSVPEVSLIIQIDEGALTEALLA
jgi:hypothetical protein